MRLALREKRSAGTPVAEPEADTKSYYRTDRTRPASFHNCSGSQRLPRNHRYPCEFN